VIYVVDTHALLWYVGGSPRLGVQADTVMSDPASRLIIPVIVLAEACWLLEHGRFPMPVDDLLQSLATERRMTVLPLDQRIVERCVGLDVILEMHDR
jgi:PIN domain nuclease of toxin-antitoxin system